MLLSTAGQGLLEFVAGAIAQTKFGMLGAILVCCLGVGIRARQAGLAVGAAVMLMLLMTQA